MSPQYTKSYDHNHIVAYGRKTGVINHLFVWTVNETSGTPDNSHRQSYKDLDELLGDWDKAAGLILERSVFFCQSFGKPDEISDKLFKFAGDITHFLQCWGK